MQTKHQEEIKNYLRADIKDQKAAEVLIEQQPNKSFIIWQDGNGKSFLTRKANNSVHSASITFEKGKILVEEKKFLNFTTLLNHWDLKSVPSSVKFEPIQLKKARCQEEIARYTRANINNKKAAEDLIEENPKSFFIWQSEDGEKFLTMKVDEEAFSQSKRIAEENGYIVYGDLNFNSLQVLMDHFKIRSL